MATHECRNRAHEMLILLAGGRILVLDSPEAGCVGQVGLGDGVEARRVALLAEQQQLRTQRPDSLLLRRVVL
eukprot:1116767-Pleurochrysis_carterae.AAC.1